MKNILLILIFSIICSNAFADVIRLKSGKIVEGIITDQTDEYIKVDTGVGIDVTYYLDEIELNNKSEDLNQPAIQEQKLTKEISTQPKDVLLEETRMLYKDEDIPVQFEEGDQYAEESQFKKATKEYEEVMEADENNSAEEIMSAGEANSIILFFIIFASIIIIVVIRRSYALKPRAEIRKTKLGMQLLVYFYGMLFFSTLKNLISTGEYFSSIPDIILWGFLCVGFFKRIKVSRVIAMGTHVYIQIRYLLVFKRTFNTEYLRQFAEAEGVSDDMVTALKFVLIVAIILFTAINIKVIMYLKKNKDYFANNTNISE